MAESKLESLFSLELLVDYVRIDGRKSKAENVGAAVKLSFLPAVAFRLLDFPTVLIYQKDREFAEVISCASENKVETEHDCSDNLVDRFGNYPFNKGKSCLFKMNIDSLHSHLSNMPLYVIVLDMYKEVPKLVGSCLISLVSTVEKFRQDVEEHGTSVPSVHGKKDIYTLSSLMGEKVGVISAGYRLLNLGPNLLPHLPQAERIKIGPQNLNGILEAKELFISKISQDNEKENEKKETGQRYSDVNEKPVKHNVQTLPDVLVEEADLGENSMQIVISERRETTTQYKSSIGTQTKESRKDRVQVLEPSSDFENVIDANIFCPPPLYYNQTAPEPKEEYFSQNECTVVTDSLHVEDLHSEEEDILDDTVLSKVYQNLHHRRNKSKNAACPVSSETAQPKLYLKDSLRQLPLLNALLMELSLLNNESSNVPFSVHPQLSWLYSAASEAPSKAPKERKSKPKDDGEKCDTSALGRRSISPKFKKEPSLSPGKPHLPFQKQMRKVQRSTSDQDKKLHSTTKDSIQPRKRLIYGLTNTLRLRLQQTNPDLLVVHERREQYRKKQAELLKGKKFKVLLSKDKSGHFSEQHQKTNIVPEVDAISHENSSLNENVETLIQNSIEEDSLGTFSKWTASLPGDTNAEVEKSLAERLAQDKNPSKTKFIEEPYKVLKSLERPACKCLSTYIINGSKPQGRDVKVCLPRAVGHDSDESVDHVSYEIGAVPAHNKNTDFPASSLDGQKLIEGNGTKSSLEHTNSNDIRVISPEYTGYSEDFTSPDPTGKYSATFDSSPEPMVDSQRCAYSDTESDYSTSKHSSTSHRTTSFSAPIPVQSTTSPVQSFKGTHIVKRHQPKLTAAAVQVSDGFDTSDTSDIQCQNQPKTESDEAIRLINLQSPRVKDSQVSSEFFQTSLTSEQKSFEDSQSIRTSQVSSCLPSNISDLELSARRIMTPDTPRDEEENLSTLGLANKYKHISEIMASKLPGYTL
ncbi:microtubule-associated protein 10 [Latimeria chalumnae]|uniref:microtubule-associated protein 10 n=1 Tax=Latimeria chalumnae TaxID=7897 RepID=UPI0003C1AE8D|nr:PREDICTED: microtubule-associated protein 10 [Latimeria chalumnae]|eukprot:XP_005992679.1 PREDICTED: microtubule-associated protein 10 [Latimeria chalumnae]